MVKAVLSMPFHIAVFALRSVFLPKAYGVQAMELVVVTFNVGVSLI